MRIGTRRSALALAQAEYVAGLLGGGELVEITTSGDRGDRNGDKSRWVAELERALGEGEIDLAVHSAKDVPGELAAGTALLGVPPRAAAADVLCGNAGLDRLQTGARVGTSSLRRLAQLRAAREDIEVVELRGNVDTRLRRLAEGELGLAAIVLARAGLQRLGREQEAAADLDPQRFVPAPGQGALLLQGRDDDAQARAASESLSDPHSHACLIAERALARELQASCHTPLGAHATIAPGGSMTLRGWVGLPDGSEWILDQLTGGGERPEELGRELATRMRAVGAAALLDRAQEMAGFAGV